jgi:hypothetical protein
MPVSLSSTGSERTEAMSRLELLASYWEVVLIYLSSSTMIDALW